MKNIDRFDRFVGFLFARLYESFPVCLDINTKSFLQEIKDDNNTSPLVFSETMFWLRDSGFVTFSSPKEKSKPACADVVPSPFFSCVVLSAKGLETLKRVPKSLDVKDGIGDMILSAVKEGSKSEVSRLVSVALSTAIGAVI